MIRFDVGSIVKKESWNWFLKKDQLNFVKDKTLIRHTHIHDELYYNTSSNLNKTKHSKV